MFGKSHRTSVWPGPGNRGYQYRCSCGATGYTTTSRSTAQAQGKQHAAKKSR